MRAALKDAPTFSMTEVPGISLLDWFAGQQLIALGQWVPGPIEDLTYAEAGERKARYAYTVARAMLRERLRTPR